MKIHILTNALDYGDAVSTHCVLLKQRASELGIPAALYAEFAHEEVREHVTAPRQLLESARPDDVLLHQLFNDTSLMPFVERFPGRRVLMYHNITPPEYFNKRDPVYLSCLRGLRLVRCLSRVYDYAVGMTEFSRRNLEEMGYLNTGVFPLFIDDLATRNPDPILINLPKLAETVFLFVGRIAPNKRIEDLLRFVSVYRRRDPAASLLLVGNDTQHAEYKKALLGLAAELSLRVGQDVVFAGKVPESHLVAYYMTSDAFVCMSEHEGFGAPLLESMAFGLPTFAYAAPACEETMGGAGVLFHDKNFEAMAEAVRWVLLDPARRQEVLATQRRRLEDFRPENQRQALLSLLDRVRSISPLPQVSRRASVVINTYNRARKLERCLATLADQTYRDFEVIVVNGPSTDETGAVLARFAGKIHVIETRSRVLSVSRNDGIARASGELVAFIDDDAVAHPRWLEELVTAFDGPDVGASGGLVYRMNGRDIEFRNGIIDREGFVRWDQPAPGLYGDWEEGYLNTVSGNNCMFRRSALEQIGGFDERIEYYHDEADVVMRLHRAGFRTVHRPGAVVYHEAAPSLNRRNPYELNWFAITKNTAYCALKNYDGPLPRWQMAVRVTLRVARERMAPMVRWWVDRKIGALALVRMELNCARGIATGLWRGLRPSPRYRSLGPVSGTAFTPFPARQPKQLSVCLLTQSLPEDLPGGIATYTIALARGLRDLGCEVHIVTRGKSFQSELRDGIWFHRADALAFPNGLLDGYEHPTLTKNLTYSNGVRAKVLDIEARWGLDLIESPNWDVEGLLTAMEHRRPVVVRAHSPMFQVCETQGWDVNEDIGLCSALEGVLLRHADAVSGSTNALLDLVGQRFCLGSKKALVPLGLDLPAGQPAPSSDGGRTILFVGRLERRKGIHTLLEAIPEVLNSVGNARFEIVGRDCGTGDNESWKQWWERHASRSAWEAGVEFHGEVGQEELAHCYEACDIFVAPSLYESFGLIYLEAMARGKAVVACRVGGVPEVVLDGETGLLVPPEDPHALAEAIVLLLRDDHLRERLGRAGRERYLALFTARAMADRSLEFYHRVTREWQTRGAVVWHAQALELLRHPDCAVVWIPGTGKTCLQVPGGSPRVAVYGPYIRLNPGSYRAEFKLWIGGVPPAHARLGSVEVFSMKHHYSEERAIWAGDFAAGPGFILDVFFTIPDPPPDDYEFRVHTSGCVPVYVREIVVSRWPHLAVSASLNSERASTVGPETVSGVAG